MKAFYALVFICLVVIIAALIISAITVIDYLRIIKTLLFDIKNIFYQFRDDRYDTRNFAKEIRDNTSAIHELLDKEPEEDDPDEDDADEDDADDPKEGWALSPCPICGEPARMAYDHDANGGYYVICGKLSRGADCNYSIVTGGPTRRIAANMWNNAAVHYTHLKLNRKKEEADADTDSN